MCQLGEFPIFKNVYAKEFYKVAESKGIYKYKKLTLLN
jgi:hypothetical protein